MGKTILISSHILSELADCCTSIGIIERGQLLMHGPIEEVYRRIRGNRTVEVRFVNGMDVGLSVIRSSPYVRNVAVDVSSCVLEMEANGQAIASSTGYTAQAIARFLDKKPALFQWPADH